MHARRLFFASLLLICGAASASADIKIKSRSSFGGQAGPETTTYIKGKRQRSEMPGGMTTVTQCDLRRTVQLNGTTRTYLVSPFADTTAAAAATAPGPRARQAEPTTRGGIVTTTVTSTDTGERKQMFGYTARRIKTTMVTESSPDSCNPQQMRMESDGWYIDLNVGFDCSEQAASAYQPAAQADGCRDTYRMKTVGTAKTGYVVYATTTMTDQSGNRTTFTQEVTEISQATLDASLFDVPADYREVKNYAEMYSAAGMSAADDVDGDAADANEAGGAQDPGDTENSSAEARPAAATPAEPKRSGGGLKSRLKGLGSRLP